MTEGIWKPLATASGPQREQGPVLHERAAASVAAPGVRSEDGKTKRGQALPGPVWS